MLDRFPIAPGSRRSYRDTWHADRQGRPHGHEGTDIAAPAGTPIVAARAGRVLSVSSDAESRCGLGVFIVVTLPDGRRELDGYCHMRAIPVVHEREPVEAGQVIGTVGATGNATSTDRHGVRHEHPHLHFQIEELPSRRRRNPFAELRAAELAEQGSPSLRAVRSAVSRSTRASSAGLGLVLVLAVFLYALAKDT